jgi:hypothetical protein
MGHILITVIVNHVAMVFLLESFIPALSPGTWMVDDFLIVILIPLV